jgi:hypothetical protein
MCHCAAQARCPAASVVAREWLERLLAFIEIIIVTKQQLITDQRRMAV